MITLKVLPLIRRYVFKVAVFRRRTFSNDRSRTESQVRPPDFHVWWCFCCQAHGGIVNTLKHNVVQTRQNPAKPSTLQYEWGKAHM